MSTKRENPARILLVFVALSACASAPPPAAPSLKITMLPPDVDVEKLVPPAAVLEPIETGTQFQTIPINGGRYCEGASGKDCSNLLAGFVVSEMVYAEAIKAKSDAGRLMAENAALRKLRSTERAAVAQGEQAYQARIVGLEGEVAALRAPTLWDRLRFPVALILGAALASGGAYAVTR